MDFLKFFGLNEDPFKLTPDPAYFYPSASHNEGLLLMDYSIDQREGFLLVIGDPGTGKTTLLKVFLENWKDRAETAIVLTPRLSPEEFLISVAEDFNINLDNKNKNEIIRALRDFMTQKSSEGKKVIIIVDEAQNLPDETLEELRLLSNLETDKAKLLQIMLIGQPELEAKLQREGLRQLNQRIITRVHLGHFSQEETLDYIKYRAIKAGKENLQIHRKAARLAYKLSNGVPRLINMLVSRALMAAYIEESNGILPRHIDHAVKSLNHSELNKRSNSWIMPAATGVAVLTVILVLVYFFTGGRGHQDMSITQKPVNHNESMLSKKSLPGGIIQKARPGTIITVSESSPKLTGDRDVSVVAVKDTFSENTDPVIHSGIVSDEKTGGIQQPPLKIISVNVDVAIIRKMPSIDATKAGWSVKGSQLIVLKEITDEREIKWYQIPYQGEKRWISEEVVDLVSLNVTSYN